MQAYQAIKLNLPLRHWVFVLSSGKDKKIRKIMSILFIMSTKVNE